MSITLGSIAPLGRPTGGVLNFPVPNKPAHLLYIHALPQRIRGEVAGETVVDTTGARMLHETALLPRWYLPASDVRRELLEPSETTTHCPFKGDARYWNVRVGDRVVTDAFWEYPTPGPGSPDLTGLLSPYVEKLDRWLEEDEEILGHPRDPFHRVDARRSSAHVVVRVRGEEVAISRHPVAVFESGLPTRWYVPLDDVRSEYLVESTTTRVCPYKGVARYWSVKTADGVVEDAAWSFQEPLLEALPVKGLVSFLGDGVEVEATHS
jgi:uncharacterized protein (DUF427 family)